MKVNYRVNTSEGIKLIKEFEVVKINNVYFVLVITMTGAKLITLL